jgi:hypothetical protein
VSDGVACSACFRASVFWQRRAGVAGWSAMFGTLAGEGSLLVR